MAIPSNFPVQLNNQPSLNINNKERIIRSVIDYRTGYTTVDTTNYNLFTFHIINNTKANISFGVSNDLINWVGVQLTSLSSQPGNLSAASGIVFTTLYGGAYQLVKAGRYIRWNQINVTTTSLTSVILHLSNANPIAKQQDLQIPNTSSWKYTAASGGITTTSAVQLDAINDPATISMLLNLDISNVGLVDSEIQIRSNATLGGGSPTVLWRTIVKAGAFISVKFNPAIYSFASNLLEVVSSASTIYINAQGVKTFGF